MILGIGIVILYLVIGAGLAKWDLPKAWDRARDQCPYSDYYLRYVKEAMFLMTFFWPLRITYILANRFMTHAAVEADPREREKKLEMEAHDARVKELEQQRYIKKLEKELGIGGTDE